MAANCDFSKFSPEDLRLMIRSGQLKRKPTTFFAIGFKQANLAILPKRYADDFRRFCQGNAGACPLLYESKPGEWKAPPLCAESDVRSDVALYNKIKSGNVDGQDETLLDYDWSDLVSFYLGCSFSFNQILLSNNILTAVDQSKNVSAFVTNIDCFESGPFKCKMVVSMRAIPADKLSLLATVTSPLPDVHGAPIHYGDPSLIGINILQNVNLGDDTEFKEGDIPVFWCCGVTGMNALMGANLNLAFSHSPGHMFLTDIPQEDFAEDVGPDKECKVIKYNEKVDIFSVLSIKTERVIKYLSHVTSEDPMGRGIKNLFLADDFEKAALALSHASSVGLVTGFPVHMDCNPPDETDGLPGVISLAAVLQSLGKKVTVIVDDHATKLNEQIIAKCVEKGLLPKQLDILPFPGNGRPVAFKNQDGEQLFDVFLATERVGRTRDVKYYSMKGKDVSSLVKPVDDLFIEATNCPNVVTIAVGDGGNELGMGKVLDKVKEYVPLGDKIACIVAADLAIAAGCSNWGCQALALALYALMSCPIHERYIRRAVGFPFNTSQLQKFIPSIEREREILSIVESAGMKDGVRPDQKMSVDGMFFDKQHADVLKRMKELL
ncbi:unnamed protein product [Clavelina lepadiformis]|uniref:D-glutamate cyclase-like C-terminal domain-containing protein n=1 Tax=Clavelina lepadiformis TaxID=159417 RepID=A0ABP0FA02_CLALP